MTDLPVPSVPATPPPPVDPDPGGAHVPDVETLATVRDPGQVARIVAAREEVLAARATMASELQVLDASARAAADIPAKIKRSPAKAAAVVGGLGFLALKGPQRVFGLGRRLVRGKDTKLPESMLPPEIEKTLRKMGSDGNKVRGTLERDFAAYAQQAQKSRNDRRNLIILSLVQPLVARGARTLADFLLAPDPRTFQERLEAMRHGLERGRPGIVGAPEPAPETAVEDAEPEAADPLDPAR